MGCLAAVVKRIGHCDDRAIDGPARVHRKRLDSRWRISRAHWPATLSSERSCRSPNEDSRARERRCGRLDCACIRAGSESQGFPPTPVCPIHHNGSRLVGSEVLPAGGSALTRFPISEPSAGLRERPVALCSAAPRRAAISFSSARAPAT